MVMTVWSLLQECAGQLAEPFRRSEIIGWFRRHHPEVNEATLAAHIQAATVNAANRAQNNPLGARAALLRRIDHGLYVRASPQLQEPAVRGAAPVSAQEPADLQAGPADLVLIGCVRTKLATAAPAAQLFASPLFAGRRRYAAETGVPWYILSAKFGLLAPADVIGPYDVYLPDRSPAYRKAWGEFVTAELGEVQGDLRGRTIEVHAGAAYTEPLRLPLAAQGASLATPLAHLRQGEQLAWYNARLTPDSATLTAAAAAEPPDPAADLALLLSERQQALSPTDLLARGPDGLQVPGLYSWWVDETGAADLSRGLGQHVAAGLIYAGQAGATRWPSGKQSASTLWGRITGMHLAGAAEFSTFRRTLAAILGPGLGMTSEDDPQLSAWISARLRVIAIPVSDADKLGGTESGVLDALDPPFNLQGRPPSLVRTRLTELRRDGNPSAGVHSAEQRPRPRAQLAHESALNQTERKFHQAMAAIYEDAKRDLGYNATRFLQMVSEQGGLPTARQLLWSAQPSDGFTTLWSHHRLDLTVEAHVLKQDYHALFTEADRQQARSRLELYGWQENPGSPV
jgi:hypothetical protein